MKTPILLIAVVIGLLPGCAQERVAGTNERDEDRHITSAPVDQVTAVQPLPGEPEIAPSIPQTTEISSLERINAPVEEAKNARKHSRAELSMSDQALPVAAGAAIVQYGIRHPAEAVDRENYLALDENGVSLVADTPVSTFSIDVDTAAYSNVRRMLVREGRLPPRDAVKAEEFINYFDYDYPNPDGGEQPFSITTELAVSPWNPDTRILQVALKGYQPEQAERPAANLVFLVDVSGSMRSEFKLNLVKKSLRLLVNQLDENDRVALVVYAGAAGQVLESTPGNQRGKIMAAIQALEAGGSTNGGAGIRLAYDIASQHFVEGGINRVLIASDGDMNVGTVSIEALKDLVEQNRERGIALTTLGFGSGNYNYALMEQIADVGNGNAAYIDNVKEAHKVLVQELGSTLQTIAGDVKIQVEFNPATVSEYRLIGYENRLLNREDFKNDKVDAGDIGAGHTVTALYEIVLANSGGELVEPLRYGRAVQSTGDEVSLDELAYVRLRYKQPGQSHSRELVRVIHAADIQESLAQTSDDFRFATAVAGFAQLLRGGRYTGEWSYPQLLELAHAARGDDRYGYRAEMVALVELSRDLTGATIGALTASVPH